MKYLCLLLLFISCSKEFIPHPGELNQDAHKALTKVWETKKGSYFFNTKQLDKDRPKHLNELITSTSLYLLRNAHSPINWRKWDEKLFEEAKKDKKPILLSIGYTNCFWCHVMDETTYDDPEIAKIINSNMIPMKVDANEIPVLDYFYMNAVKAVTGEAGWPQTVWLDHDKMPFYAARYVDLASDESGMKILLERVSDLYSDVGRRLIVAKNKLKAVYDQQYKSLNGDIVFENKSIEKIIEFTLSRYNKDYGGFTGNIKFPLDFPIENFIFYFYTKKGSKRSKDIVNYALNTLTTMYNGSLFDHVAGGFFEYTKSPNWALPHYQKNSLDNAMIANLYIKAHKLTKNPLFKQVAEETINFLIRDMRDEKTGLFYTSLSSHSKNRNGVMMEGLYYTWVTEELKTVLKPKEIELVVKLYGVRDEIRKPLAISKAPHLVASELALTPNQMDTALKAIKAKLYLQRKKYRYAPFIYKTSLTSHNAMIISSLIQYSHITKEKDEYLKHAIKAGEFIWSELNPRGNLHRFYVNGEKSSKGSLSDHVTLIKAYLDLFEATGERKWYERSIILDRTVQTEFESSDGRFLMSKNLGLPYKVNSLVERKSFSPTSVQMDNLLRFFAISSQEEFAKRFIQSAKQVSPWLENAPFAIKDMARVLESFFKKFKSVFLIEKDNKDFSNFLTGIYFPNKVMIRMNKNEEFLDIIPKTAGKIMIGNKETGYVCENQKCSKALTNLRDFSKALSK